MSSPSPSTYHANLITSLTTINTHNPPVHTCSTGWSFHGILSGPTSIAYLFYQLSILYPGYVFKGQEFLEWAECYLELGRYAGGGGGGGVGVRCEGVVGRVVRGVVEGDEGVVGEVCGAVTTSGGGGTESESSNDWENGRAGFLYLLRILRSRFPGSKRKIQTTIDRVIDTAMASKELQYGTVTMSNVHIVTGIATQIILSRVDNHIDGLERILDDILALQNPDGNWNESTPWIINSLASILQYTPAPLQTRISSANERARSFLYHADPSSTPPTLQPHGLVTRALAFTDPNDDRFHEVLGMASGEWLDENRPGWRDQAGKRDEWVGLNGGEAGRAWGWVVGELSADGAFERRILGYNDV